MRARHRKWKPEDDMQLQQLRATGMKWSVVAKKLNKTEAATIGRAGVLRISKLRQEPCELRGNTQTDLPGRSEAIRRLVEIGLKAKSK